MKILLTVDPEIPVPPEHYGGIERIVDGLSHAYKKLGHKTILVANPESTCAGAERIYGWRGARSQSKQDILLNAVQLYQIYKKEKPEILHSFSRLLYLYPLFFFSRACIVQSYQRAISTKSTCLAKKIAGSKLEFTACGAHLFRNFPNINQWKAIHNFADIEYLVPDSTRSTNYLLFLGRIEPIKGVKSAIQVAIASGEKLIIAGNIPKTSQQYFDQDVKPLLSENIIYVGPVNDYKKKELLQGAKALLFPIDWEEPFGIVMAESLACGVPVIAFRRGSVSEVIINGVNGFICDDLSDMIEAVYKIGSIDRQKCRDSCEDKFSSHVIALKYIELFNKLLRNDSKKR